ncbi:MAG: DUF4093 domain-containing protein [Ruminococcaceae bacterium]|nr:DUF4093 domain-containing protein [Oscillospiraceae bacterium]
MCDTEKLSLKEVIIVEGKYDKIQLQTVVKSPIITLNGFRVFKDKEAQSLIRNIAKTRGILIMTDVDSAGFVLRNFLNGIADKSQIKHCYIPTVFGKEKRKAEFSKEGKIGVEGIDREKLVNAIKSSGATINGDTKNVIEKEITKLDFYDLGLCGKDDSSHLRKALLTHLGLPTYMSTNAMISAMNCLYTYDEFNILLNKFFNNTEVQNES